LLSGGAIDLSLFQGRAAGLMNDTESDIMGNFVTALTTNVVGSYGTAVTEANVASLAAKIFTQKPPRGTLHGFVSPTAWAQMVQIANFNSGSVRGFLTGEPAPSVSENYGEPDRPWHGVHWHMCQEVSETSTSGNGNTTNVVAHE